MGGLGGSFGNCRSTRVSKQRMYDNPKELITSSLVGDPIIVPRIAMSAADSFRIFAQGGVYLAATQRSPLHGDGARGTTCETLISGGGCLLIH